jgi:tetratricopeptide (TPR) repeat protein
MIQRLIAGAILIFAFNVKGICQSDQIYSDTTGDSSGTSSNDNLWDWLLSSDNDTSATEYSATTTNLNQIRETINTANYDSALQLVNQYFENDSLNNEIWYLLGFIYDRKENLPRAMECYHKSIELDSTYWGPYRDLAYLYEVFAKNDSLHFYLNKAMQYSPTPESLYYDYGYSFDVLGNGDSALVYYHKAIENNPRDIDAYLNIGALWGANNYIDSAMIYTQQALELNPALPQSNYNYAEILKSEGDSTRAIDYYQKALALDPSLIETKLRLGELYEGLGDSTMAKMYYQEFVDSNRMDYYDDIQRIKTKLESYR